MAISLLGDVIQLRRVRGQPIHVGEVTITPEARSLMIRLPFGGFVWNEPIAAQVSHGGEGQRMEIARINRRAWMGMILLGTILTIAAFAASRREENRHDE